MIAAQPASLPTGCRESFVSDQRDVQLRLITLIYDAALNPDAWSRCLEAFADVVNGHGLSIGHIDVESPRLSISSLARWDPDALTEYAAHFVHRDPWGRAAAERGLFVPGTVGTGEAVV